MHELTMRASAAPPIYKIQWLFYKFLLIPALNKNENSVVHIYQDLSWTILIQISDRLCPVDFPNRCQHTRTEEEQFFLLLVYKFFIAQITRNFVIDNNISP